MTDSEKFIIKEATEAFNQIGIGRFANAGQYVGELLNIINSLQVKIEVLEEVKRQLEIDLANERMNFEHFREMMG